MHFGGCLCGAVRYKLNGELRGVINCFCEQCRRTSGHHVAATSVPLTQFTLEKDDQLNWYTSSESAQRGFCGKCGSNLFWKNNQRENISIMAGTLDTPTGLATVENIFVEDMSDYHVCPQLTG